MHVRDLVGEVLCLDRDGRQKFFECTTRRDRQLLLHVPRRVTAEQSCIAFAQDAGKALAIDAALVQHAGQGLLRERELLARLQAFQFGDALLDDSSDERRVGKESVSTCCFRWWPYHLKTKTVKKVTNNE